MSKLLTALAMLASLVVAAQATDDPAAPHADVVAGGSELCLVCHSELDEATAAAHVHDPLAKGDCTSCHDPHVARYEHLLRREPDRLCMSCHTNLRDELRLPVVHKALRDENACSTCHDPHGTSHAGLLREQTGTLCAECHEGVSTQLELEHAHFPAAEGECGTCHVPHAGTDLALLTETQPDVCVACHPADADLDTAHRGFAVAEANCGNCHAPHGTAEAALIRPVPHLPFTDDDCSICHANPREPSALTAEGATLCEVCHGDYGAEGAEGHHPPIPETACISCHSPHAGEAPAAMAGPQHLVCLECHTDLAQRMSVAESYHPRLVEGGSCSACHLPHGSGHQPLLKKAEAELCSDCHDDHSKFAHPMGPNVDDPLRPGKSLDCLSCHDPHASEHKMMLIGESDRDLCVGCHANMHSGG